MFILYDVLYLYGIIIVWIFYQAMPDLYMHRVCQIPLERIQMNLPGSPHWLQVFLSYLLHGTPPSLLLTPVLFAHLRRRGIPVWYVRAIFISG